MKSTGICSLVSFLGGILVGSMVAVLTTPQSGPDLRNKIRDYAQQEAEKMRCNCNDHK
ncbi:MAG: YtxH domain-containing protein [Alistipes sp.]|nr:YtxH domain-containing protein [Alistipes sp.]MBR5811647.1 YtxH domain-containing protein [Alistipes sp.]